MRLLTLELFAVERLKNVMDTIAPSFYWTFVKLAGKKISDAFDSGQIGIITLELLSIER